MYSDFAKRYEEFQNMYFDAMCVKDAIAAFLDREIKNNASGKKIGEQAKFYHYRKIKNKLLANSDYIRRHQNDKNISFSYIEKLINIAKGSCLSVFSEVYLDKEMDDKLYSMISAALISGQELNQKIISKALGISVKELSNMGVTKKHIELANQSLKVLFNQLNKYVEQEKITKEEMMQSIEEEAERILSAMKENAKEPQGIVNKFFIDLINMIVKDPLTFKTDKTVEIQSENGGLYRPDAIFFDKNGFIKGIIEVVFHNSKSYRETFKDKIAKELASVIEDEARIKYGHSGRKKKILYICNKLNYKNVYSIVDSLGDIARQYIDVVNVDDGKNGEKVFFAVYEHVIRFLKGINVRYDEKVLPIDVLRKNNKK